jgi:hypothetical protein
LFKKLQTFKRQKIFACPENMTNNMLMSASNGLLIGIVHSIEQLEIVKQILSKNNYMTIATGKKV